MAVRRTVLQAQQLRVLHQRGRQRIHPPRHQQRQAEGSCNVFNICSSWTNKTIRKQKKFPVENVKITIPPMALGLKRFINSNDFEDTSHLRKVSRQQSFCAEFHNFLAILLISRDNSFAK